MKLAVVIATGIVLAIAMVIAGLFLLSFVTLLDKPGGTSAIPVATVEAPLLVEMTYVTICLVIVQIGLGLWQGRSSSEAPRAIPPTNAASRSGEPVSDVQVESREIFGQLLQVLEAARHDRAQLVFEIEERRHSRSHGERQFSITVRNDGVREAQGITLRVYGPQGMKVSAGVLRTPWPTVQVGTETIVQTFHNVRVFPAASAALPPFFVRPPAAATGLRTNDIAWSGHYANGSFPDDGRRNVVF